MRNLIYAKNIKDHLLEFNIAAEIVQLDHIEIDKNNFIILDAHYKGKMYDCEGIKFAEDIRLLHGNFQSILLMSWFSENQIQKYKIADKETMERLFNYRFEQFPLTGKIIESFLKINKYGKYEY
ncbi:MAG: hypothetical protein K8S00_10195 [Bacteroidales bacterium]|nr:hypothetical protein [Bacteroidales bacterium]